MRAEIERRLASGDFAGAWQGAESALRDAPEDAQLNLLAGNALLALGEAEAALDHIHLALHYDRHYAAALSARVRALEQLGRPAQAEAAYREFLLPNPGNVQATIGLALAVRRRGEFEQAASLLESLLQSSPQASEALSLLGLIQAREFGLLPEGEALVRRALDLDPHSDAALSNLGWILVLQQRYGEGIRCMDQVLEKHPDSHETRLMRAYAYLRQAEFAQGWKDIEARHHSRLATIRPFEFRRWEGEALGGRTLLVYGEQGLGDQIMYASCVPDVLARVVEAPGAAVAGNVILECEPRLVGLFRRSFAAAIVVAQTPEFSMPASLNKIGPIDLQIPAGSLPSMFRSSWSDFPDHRGYLHADAARVAAWRERLNRLSPLPKIGISWRGGSPHTRRRLRSIGLGSWRPILSLPATFVSLQYGEVALEIDQAHRTTGARIHHFPEIDADYDDTAALASALDLVITVCTAVAHLSGALGKEAWVMTPAVPEWRYLDRGESMPWYPAVRLIRQGSGETWEPVIERSAGLLHQRLGQLPRRAG